ncbi:MAG: T9SS type A sorting domain-containing protein, partial [Ferruginibacter sp.]|nr:T9SS type A sorting domain-containing protein [Cytophagales bacterium]
TATASFSFTVNPLPVVNAGGNGTICADAAPFTLTGFSPAGGAWSGNGVDAAGVFTPSGSLVGPQTLTYSVTQSGCSGSATKTVTVEAPPTVVAGIDENSCASDPAFPLAGFSPAGGVWSGNGVTAAGVFTPSAGLVGDQILTYTVAQGSCTQSATKTVTVRPATSVDGIPVNSTNCLVPDGSISLTVTGGVAPYAYAWSNGATTQNLAGLGAGTYAVTVTDANGCSAGKLFTLSDPNAPVAFGTTGGGTFCQGGAGRGVGLAGSEAGVNYQLRRDGTPVGSPLVGTGGGLDFGTQTTAGGYTVTATNPGGCSATMTGGATVGIDPVPSLAIVDPAPVCSPGTVDLTTLTVTDAAATTGTLTYWTDAAATVTLSNPNAVAVGGTYYVKKTTAGGCADTRPVVVTIQSGTPANAGANESRCAGAPAFVLTGFSPAGGTWSGNGVDAAGTFTPAAALVGTQTLTYSVNDGSCVRTATKTVTVTPLPTAPTASANTPTVGESLNLTASSVTNATYQWTGPDGFTASQQNPTIPGATTAKAGLYSVTATVDGCSSPAGTVNAMVNPAPVPVQVGFALDLVAGQTGTAVVVRVRVKDFRNIVSAQGSIRWNAAVAAFAGVESFGLPGLTAADFGTTQTGSGTLVFAWSDDALQPRTLADDATLFALRFNLVGSTGAATAITLEDAPVAVEVVSGAQAVPVTRQAGRIEVISIASVAGTIRSATGTPVRGVSLNVRTSSTTQTYAAAADGTFGLSLPSGASYLVWPTKNDDVVTNNGVSTLDLILIQRHILGLTALGSPYRLIAADVNRSGTVTTLDIVLIRSLILQNIPRLPGNQWAFVRSDATFANPANPFPYDSTRTYVNATSVGSQDFVGIKLGDVNDTWNAGVARTETAGEVAFNWRDQSALPGQEIAVPVKVGGFSGVSGYQFTLAWDPRVVKFVAISHGAVEASYGVAKASEGQLTTTWQAPSGGSRTLPDDTTAFYVRFRVVGGLGSETPFRITSSLTASEAYNARLERLSVASAERKIRIGEATSALPAGYELYPGQPNPFGEQTTIRFSLPRPERVNLVIYNAIGQPIKRFDGTYPAGEHRITWDGEGESGGKLGAGTYFVQLRAGGFVKVRKLVLVR